MNIDKSQFTHMNPKQMAMAAVSIVLFIAVFWMIIGLFRHGKSTPTPPKMAMQDKTPAMQPAAIHGASSAANNEMMPKPSSGTPQPAVLNAASFSVQEQAAFASLQHEVQEKYVAALNELQMLRLAQQIATTNKEIAAAKLATIEAEKKIVDLLTKPAPQPETSAAYSNALAHPESQQAAASYIVLSVSELLNKWRAVIGYQGKLYSVFAGDVLPPDQSKVISIDRYGVLLEDSKGEKRRLSLVPVANG